MQVDEDQIAALLQRPSEGLSVELKSWFDPQEPEGTRLFVRAVFAIRNRNGGFLVVGFDDKSLQPTPYNLSDPVERTFHVDRLQGLVTRYAHEPFEIAVTFRERDAQVHPVIAIPEGVRAPVIVKSGLMGPGGKQLLSEGDIFVRTLNANGTPSSSKALPRDFADLLEICFENREADIGRFLRRQLGSGDLSRFLEAFAGISKPVEATHRELATIVLDRGSEAFSSAVEQRGVNKIEQRAIDGLTMEVGLWLTPQRDGALPTSSFLNAIASANPQYTGWPIWLDSRGFNDAESRPVVVEDRWQALIVDVGGGWSQHLDFMFFSPTGSFYLRRAMQDDLSEKVQPGVALDVVLMIYRVAEVLAVGLNIAKAAGWADEDRAGFAFRWTALHSRRLSSWANPLRSAGGGISASSSAVGYSELSVARPPSAVAPNVREATGPLFALFGGYEPPMTLIEDCVRRLIERDMK